MRTSEPPCERPETDLVFPSLRAGTTVQLPRAQLLHNDTNTSFGTRQTDTQKRLKFLREVRMCRREAEQGGEAWGHSDRLVRTCAFFPS